jgi:hypothetical protein
MIAVLNETIRWCYTQIEFPNALGLTILAFSTLAAGLGILWLVLVIRRRRSHPRLIIAAVLLAGAGALASHWHDISVNLALRDAAGVREECVHLLRQYQADPRNDGMGVRLDGEKLPASFRRLSAKAVVVHPKYVLIVVAETRWHNDMWGYLYDPEHTYRPNEMGGVSPTWYSDIYEFIEYGDH